MRKRAAFSFVEIVIAVGILAFAVIPLMTSSQQSTRIAGQNIYRVTALNLANGMMERYKSMPFATLKEAFSGSEEVGKQVIASDSILNTKSLPAYHVKFVERFERLAKFEPLSSDPNLGLLTVSVRFRRNPKMVKSEVSLKRIVVDYEKVGYAPMTVSGDYAYTVTGGEEGVGPLSSGAGSGSGLWAPGTNLSTGGTSGGLGSPGGSRYDPSGKELTDFWRKRYGGRPKGC